MSYNVNEKGYYGEFGGAYIPEMLYPNVEELRQKYLKVTAEPEFQAELSLIATVRKKQFKIDALNEAKEKYQKALSKLETALAALLL